MGVEPDSKAAEPGEGAPGEDAAGDSPVVKGAAGDGAAEEGTAGDGAKGEKKSSGKGGGLRESVLLVVSGVVAALLLNMFVIQSFDIPSESMENTLKRDDKVIVNKLHGETERGDVVVFTGWRDEYTIKRVIAVGGDTVKCCDAQGRITVNGVPLDEKPYLHPDDFPSGDKFEKVVPKGRLWVMGDHRSASADSRAHEEQEGEGTISEDQVIGRAFAIYWPFSRATVLSTPDTLARTFANTR
ncbi:signal peptidase I [Streptosporangium pseudovulgare]|uniref:signal peptidase I n=1 Tax=Streptosporangium pseudovulgare TaxID=35765 RepID=UPI0016704A45